jgi:transcriptional regulator
MYLPTHFAETRPDVLHEVIRRHPLGTLITVADDGPVADEIPFLIDPSAGPHGHLHAHLARANPLCRGEPDGRKVLVLFRGPQAYVSPAWYPSKAEHGRVVPTWNYVVVQATGRLRLIDDEAWIRGQIDRLTAQQEAGRTVPWRVNEAPEDFIAQQFRAIVGVEIVIDSVCGKWKTSQNRNAADRLGVATGLAAEDDELARRMAPLVAP